MVEWKESNATKLLMIEWKESDVIMMRIYMAGRLYSTLAKMMAVPKAAKKETPTEQDEPAILSKATKREGLSPFKTSLPLSTVMMVGGQ
mmetsp:Transcript_30804/g.50315  ORF Transcript_30804/g.50315 Transcript_30804/m.50315 type:complete len:89 (+) Transcript_30804:513-779(+)